MGSSRIAHRRACIGIGEARPAGARLPLSRARWEPPRPAERDRTSHKYAASRRAHAPRRPSRPTCSPPPPLLTNGGLSRCPLAAAQAAGQLGLRARGVVRTRRARVRLESRRRTLDEQHGPAPVPAVHRGARGAEHARLRRGAACRRARRALGAHAQRPVVPRALGHPVGRRVPADPHGLRPGGGQRREERPAPAERHAQALGRRTLLPVPRAARPRRARALREGAVLAVPGPPGAELRARRARRVHHRRGVLPGAHGLPRRVACVCGHADRGRRECRVDRLARARGHGVRRGPWPAPAAVRAGARGAAQARVPDRLDGAHGEAAGAGACECELKASIGGCVCI